MVKKTVVENSSSCNKNELNEGKKGTCERGMIESKGKKANGSINVSIGADYVGMHNNAKTIIRHIIDHDHLTK